MKLVRSTSQGKCPGGCLKGQGGGERHVKLPLDPLPIVCTSSAWGSSAGATTIPYQIALGRLKADGPQTGLHSTYTQWGSRYAWSGEPLARWKTRLLGPIVVGEIVWKRKVSDTFSHFKSEQKAEGWHRWSTVCLQILSSPTGHSNLSQPQTSSESSMAGWQRRSSPIGIGPQIRASWTIPSYCTPGGLHGMRCSFSAWTSKAGRADMPDCPHCSSGLEEAAQHTFYYFWEHVTHIEPKQLMLFNIGCIVDKVLPPLQGEKSVVFLTILAVARMAIWMTWKMGLYDDANFSYCDLILFFRHQFKVKIRCNIKHLDHIKFDKRWVNAVSLFVRKGAMLKSSFPPLPAHGSYGLGPLGPHPW